MFASKDLFLTRPSGGYQISRSVRTRSSASAYFNRTFTTPTLGTKWSWSAWVKRGTLGAAQTLFGGSSDVNNWGYIGFLAGDTLTFQQADAASVTSTVTTTQVFRDPSAWYHIVVVFDSTQATAANRLLMYVNGVQITAFGTATYLAQNTASRINQAVGHTIYRLPYSAANYVDGYLTEINFIDGQALTPSSFGQTNAVTGVWQPIKYTGTYGTNGFYLNFSDNSAATATTIGKDYSGNSNNWTPNNISVTAGVTYDSMIDVPTLFADGGNGRGNYCVLNPLDFTTVGTISEANLRFTQSSLFARSGRATIGVASGKWYWEVTNLGGNNSVGVQNASASLSTYTGGDANGWAYFIDGNKYNNNIATAYGASYTTNDVIGIALDMDAGTLTFYKNNVSQGQAFSGLSGTLFPGFSASAVVNVTFVANFGQRPFTYTPPSGYVALNTQNLPAPTISNGATVMAASTYTGTGATQTIANSGNNAASISFKPDWVWIKSRSAATNNNLFDSVRGTTNYLISNSTAAEATNANTLTAFGTTGFTLGSDASALGVNVNAATYVAWQWQAGQGSTSSNTSGSITSTVSVNATAGFSVVTYSGNGAAGATVGHGLGVAPNMIIVKCRTAGTNSWTAWQVYHSSLTNPATSFLRLNETSAVYTGYAAAWNSTNPTSSVFSVSYSAGSGVNGSGDTFVAYCFSAVRGYSNAFSFTGNGSADGVFVYLGFRPRMVLLKRTDTTGNWYIWDTSRNTYNVVGEELYPNLSNAGSTATDLDILSNGFKMRNTTADFNASGGSYIGFAWAENPFKLSLAR